MTGADNIDGLKHLCAMIREANERGDKGLIAEGIDLIDEGLTLLRFKLLIDAGRATVSQFSEERT